MTVVHSHPKDTASVDVVSMSMRQNTASDVNLRTEISDQSVAQ